MMALQIEPDHLDKVYIPYPDRDLRMEISNLINQSYKKRDESNELLRKAQKKLLSHFQLPNIKDLEVNYFKDNGVKNYTTKLSELRNRIDASFYKPISRSIISSLKQNQGGVTKVGDRRFTKSVYLPSRFSRVYVNEGQGTLFFGGKNLFELEPSKRKYLSVAKHRKRLKNELALKENMILITRSGTVGKVNIVPSHWEKWAASEHIIRIIPSTPIKAGYLYAYLTTDHGRKLIETNKFGSVVSHINEENIKQIPLPESNNLKVEEEIGALALKSKERLTEAYYLEQKAIKRFNREIFDIENF